MEIEFLGTGAGSPAKSRNVTSIALKLLEEINEVWLFDVGEGTQHQILKTSIRPRKVTRIFYYTSSWRSSFWASWLFK